ncbi:hypothetical protein ACFXNW_07595 [Nocardia sp. NPDC059180]|uniref:hypothetical protein n=1 Tax=Nocardia sp. NPDC059180 TaxID=3346761 RepID=UPI0036B50B59
MSDLQFPSRGIGAAGFADPGDDPAVQFENVVGAGTDRNRSRCVETDKGGGVFENAGC